MANYSGYTQQQYNNQKAYLDGLSKNGTAGQKAWAQNELNSLNSQYGGNKNSGNSGTTQKVTNSGNSGSKNNGNSGGTNYGDYTQDQYHNQNSYLNNMINTGTAGQKEWAKNELDKLNSQYSDGSSGYWFENPDGKTGTHYDRTNVGTWDTSGDKWTNVGGTDVNYAISSDNGTIIVTDDNGVQTRFLPTSADYNSFYQNMMSDINSAGNSYTPKNTFTNANGTYTTKSYTAGNKDLQYALEQAAKTNPGISVGDYAESLYNRVGSQRSDGTTVSLDDVTKELTRLGLQDYLPGNAVYTAGGTLLPGNEFVSYHDNNGQTSNSEDSRWASYGGQDYLVGGDSSNFVNYVNALTGNYNNLDYIFGGQNMANNPYAQENPEFLNQFNQQLAALYAQAGGNGGSAVGGGNVNTNINNNYNNNSLGGYVGSLGALSGATGQNYASDLWSQIEAMLKGGNDAYNQFLDSQQATAEKNAEELARQAWVRSQLAGDGLKEGLSAAGLGASGALQSAQLGVQNSFNNSLADINNSLNDMSTSINEQKLAALTDLNKNLTDYAYQIQNDEYNRAMQQAQLYQQQLEYQKALEQQQWENAYQQQLLDIQNKQYADETANAQKAQQAEYYANLYNIGQISGAQYQQYLRQLGLIA